MSSRAEHLTPSLLRGWQLSQEAAGKDDRGTVLVIGGAHRTPGAAVLTGLAALRTGAGRLTLAVAESAAVAAAIAVPECGVVGLPEHFGDDDDAEREGGGAEREGGGAAGKSGTSSSSSSSSVAAVLEEDLAQADVVVIGPGLDDADRTTALLRGIAPLLKDETSLVLDAYALGVLIDLEPLYRRWVGRLVLTPNRVEAARLLGVGAVEMASAVSRIAAKYGSVVTGQRLIADPDGRLWDVGAGNPGLGTSGSGDVLAGAVAGFLARKATPAQAACWATYLHATAGDRLAATIGPISFLARELLDAMPRVLAELST
ncbi:ADP/ATP-dependent (S)-NAD(P)H-hydrate dehydratase [Paenarthrobacter sp. PH39-S1]|uniref:ADP-dependent NAD(P)H-hydrate dehydratase n=1 Tax=Paenarthrobacter sp. PH39-S1 TaxID=3046204 RepID=UPI0024B95F0F|nr:ADP/ATP-dependent (S)-NAD(P)H-hydrate dehydratase [Paenarthrobacter sp. PH39-S1]MDJ0358098.1 NAD(P)H-hydrate dehydratase [Paenarthrobacter sp. PH39-S1]